MEEMASNIDQNTKNAIHAEKISMFISDGIQQLTKAAQESNKFPDREKDVVSKMEFMFNYTTRTMMPLNSSD